MSTVSSICSNGFNKGKMSTLLSNHLSNLLNKFWFVIFHRLGAHMDSDTLKLLDEKIEEWTVSSVVFGFMDVFGLIIHILQSSFFLHLLNEPKKPVEDKRSKPIPGLLSLEKETIIFYCPVHVAI